jgi:hypothetical protein
MKTYASQNTVMYLNQTIAKLKSGAASDKSGSPKKRQKTGDSSPKDQLEPDNFPLEDIVGEALF